MISSGHVDTDQEGEDVSRCLKEDLSQSFEVVLKDLPEVYLHIQRLNKHIKKQQYTLVNLYEKLKEYRQTSNGNLKTKFEMKSVSTQTESSAKELVKLSKDFRDRPKANLKDSRSEWTSASAKDAGKSLADEVKEVAESAMQQTGFVYEETSGMYYDYNTGYYYNAEMGLYYDGNSGTYLYYNESSKTYEYHSQAQSAMPATSGEADQVALSSAPIVTVEAKILKDTTIGKVKKSSKKKKLDSPDPLEIKEADLDMPGSNPMAPVLAESSNISSPRECHREHEAKSAKDSKHERKRKAKHKKHKSKKKKKRRHHSHPKSENSLEEGECSDSSGSERENERTEVKLKSVKETHEEIDLTEDISPLMECSTELSKCENVSQNWNKRRLSDEASEAWPPCMRIIVENTQVKKLNVGMLFIVTCKGGTLGREKFHAVSIPDINISKHHGIFTFDELSGKYFLTDYGSRNGTYVNKHRLSSAKQESEPCEISHGAVITLGSTDLLCHIHPGRETCAECEPGVVAARKAEDVVEVLHTPSIVRESKSERRWQELKRLRKRFGLEGNENKSDFARLAPGYEDRAEIRRVTVGSQNAHAKTETASATESIRPTNKGFKMLAKMGWKEGEALGKDGSGLTEPVLVSQRADKAGLGADNAFVADARPRGVQAAQADKWQRARQRYGQLPDTVDGLEDGAADDDDDA